MLSNLYKLYKKNMQEFLIKKKNIIQTAFVKIDKIHNVKLLNIDKKYFVIFTKFFLKN